MDESMNKKGQSTFALIFGIIFVFMLIIGLIIVGIISSNINNALDIDIDVGQVNLREVNLQTIGQFNLMITEHADFWGIAMIFGMIIGLFLSSYFTRNQFPKIGIIIDIGIILVVFILSLYLRSIYSDVVTALNNAGQSFAIISLQNTNFFILNLPIFVAIIGVIMIILFHSGLPPKSEELNVVSPQVVTG